jgi:hypothetical protein|tara:strand:+ start:2761 stop:3162 length:402 start_codon:yes stop_codon:yes gene_type:complete
MAGSGFAFFTARIELNPSTFDGHFPAVDVTAVEEVFHPIITEQKPPPTTDIKITDRTRQGRRGSNASYNGSFGRTLSRRLYTFYYYGFPQQGRGSTWNQSFKGIHIEEYFLSVFGYKPVSSVGGEHGNLKAHR